MITRDLHTMTNPEWPGIRMTHTLAKVQEWAGSDPLWTIEPAPYCQCCGAQYGETGYTQWPNGQVRCRKHYGRNPCAIEGCTRTTSADGDYRDDNWLCGEHWRRFVPPRSKYRRHYHALHRRGKRLDWPVRLRRQYWRYWAMMVRRARRLATEGQLDVAEINRVMGW